MISKFSLDGFKLKGSWVLVRTRGYGAGRQDGRSWLLIKHRDDWSGDLDITEFAPLSVKTGDDFAAILAAERPDVWRSGRPALSGETGAMLRQVIDEAATLRLERAPRAAGPRAGRKPRADSKAATGRKLGENGTSSRKPARARRTGAARAGSKKR